MNPSPVALPSEFKDRKAGLIIFGVLTTLLGLISSLTIPISLFGRAAAARAGTPMHGSVASMLFILGGFALVIVWLGIGSILARRWARALLLIFSWNWLALGLLSFAATLLMMPKLMHSMDAQLGEPDSPGAAMLFGGLIPGVIAAFVYIALPIAWLMFYSSKNVKATCEALDPGESWTDRCPLPVLAVSLWLILGAASMFMAALFSPSTLPAFGVFLTGFVTVAIRVGFGAIWAYCAWAFYRLDRSAWWLIVLLLLLSCASSMVTYSRHSVAELSAAMGYSHRAGKSDPTSENLLPWVSIGGTLLMLGYLVYVRRFFPPAAAPSHPPSLEA